MNIWDASNDGIFENLGQANVFYTKNYAQYITRSDLSNYKLLYSDKYVMPIVINKRYCFKYAYLPVEPFVHNINSNQSLKEFLNEAMDFANKKLKVQWVTPTFASALFSSYPDHSLRIPFGSRIIDLYESEDELFGGMEGKCRNVIRRAQNGGVVVRNGFLDLVDDYCVLDEQTWERSSRRGNGKCFYENIINQLKDNSIIFISYKDDEPQGGAVFFYNKSMSYCMFAASKNSPYTGSMNLLHWEAMKYMKREGVKKYSFVGNRINEDKESKFHSIQRFKQRFGGELVEGYMFKTVFNRSYYNLFKILVTVKSHHLFQKDAIDQELSKWVNLNNEKSDKSC